jgi:imidazolonepropionase-like amidohydrolase
MDFYTPSRTNHGAYWYDWTTEDEIAWRNFYQVWFKLLNDYKKMGGRVTVSADAAFIYNTYGFGNIHEMELLQEAGFHPLEVIQAASYNPAMTLAEAAGKPIDRGWVRAGLLADMIVVDQNPLKNLKVFYGTGALRLNDQSGKPEWIGGINTIKDGIVRRKAPG